MAHMFRSKQIPLHEKDFPFTYEQLKQKRMPPSAFKTTTFVPEDFANFPGIPSNGEGKVDFEKSDAPAMRVQANFIPGGLVLSMYMHHTVLDFSGVTTFWQVYCANVSKVSGLGEHVDFRKSVLFFLLSLLTDCTGRLRLTHGSPNQCRRRSVRAAILS